MPHLLSLLPILATTSLLVQVLPAQSPPAGAPDAPPSAAPDRPTRGPAAPPGTFTTYGTGCQGSFRLPGGPVVPKAYATKWGEIANYYPHGKANMQYQQTFSGSEIGVQVINGLAFRLDDAYGGPAGTMPIKLTIGRTTLDSTTIGTSQTFAANFDTGAPVVVFNGNWSFPQHSPPNTDLTSFVPNIPFSAPFVFTGTPNLLVEIVNTATADVVHFFDYTSSSTTTRIWATPIAATPTGMGRGTGLVMQLRTASGNPAVPQLGAVGVPEINKTFQITLALAKPNSAAALVIGGSRTAWGPFRLPLDLTPFGAPSCTLLAAMDVMSALPVNASGASSVNVALPNVQGLIGVHFYCQFAVVDAGANVLGLAWSNAADAGIGG